MFLSDILENNTIQLLQTHRNASVVVGVISLGLLYQAFHYSERNHRSSPLVPYTWPIVGSSTAYNRNPEEFLKKCLDQYGPVFRVHIGGRVKTIVSGDLVMEIFKGPEFSFHEGFRKLIDVNLLLDMREDDLHLEEIRRVIAKLTLQLRQFTPCIVGSVSFAHDEILKRPPFKGGNFSSRGVQELILRMLAQSSASTFLGSDTVKAHPEVVDAFTGFIPIVTDLIGSSLIRGAIPGLTTFRVWYARKTNKNIKKYKKALTDALRPIITKRLFEQEQKDDMIQWFIDIRYKNMQDLDLEDVVEGMTTRIIFLIFASMHTSGTNTTTVFYNLVKYPWLVEELLREQQEVLGKHGISPDEEDPIRRFTGPVLKDLVKLDSTIRESLRTRKLYLQHPRAYTGKADYVLSNGAVIKPDEDILLSNWLNHNDPALHQIQHTNLDEFLPFRFVETDLRATKAGSNNLAFGGGKHLCPGRFFAVQQMKAVLSFLIYRYKLTAITPVVTPSEAYNRLPFGDVFLERRGVRSECP